MLLAALMVVTVAAVSHALVTTAAREATAARRLVSASRDLTAVWALTSQELAHAAAADVASPAATALEYDRPVGEGPVCAVEPFAVILRTGPALLQRYPGPGRDLVLLREPRHSGLWFRRGIVSVAVANCPDGAPGLRLSTDGPTPAAGMVRILEPVRLRSYLSGTQHWVGLESRIGGATLQPLAGPLTSTDFTVTLLADALRVALSSAPLSPLLLELPLAPAP
jgi:hypothetical protein